MSELIGQSAKPLSKELRSFCKSELLSEEGLREIIDCYGIIHVGDYKFFREACRNERVTEGIIQCLLRYFPDAASAANENGLIPLHLACYNKNVTLNIIRFLIDAAPASVRSVTNIGRMPLHCLCQNRKLDEAAAIQILKLIIEKYAEAVRHVDNNGCLPIHIAAAAESPDFCRVLVEAYPGSERKNSAGGSLPLHLACLTGSLATVKYLFRLHSDAIIHPSNGGFYPIHAAISSCTKYRVNPATVVAIVRFLLNCDTKVKLQKWRGRSLLRYACRLAHESSNIDTALQIIGAIYDAHPEAIEDNHIASKIQGYHQQVQAFINGELIYARQAKDHRLMTTPDDNGRLPLHVVLQNNVRLGSIKLLIKGNLAAIISPDNSGALPLHIACQHHDSTDIIDYLVELDNSWLVHDSTLDAVDRNGNTALHYACLGAKYDTITLLLEKYNAVSVSKRNDQEKLPIEILWESNAVEDRGSLKYTESVFQLLLSYPEMVTINNLALEQSIDVDQTRNVKKRKLDHAV